MSLLERDVLVVCRIEVFYMLLRSCGTAVLLDQLMVKGSRSLWWESGRWLPCQHRGVGGCQSRILNKERSSR
jgi:hypothetical protein